MSFKIPCRAGFITALLASMATTTSAFAEAAAEAPKLDTGDTAWMLTSTALVLMMTIPGLALFYGGMVRQKNVLATIMQSFAICCLVTVLWMVLGYSLALTEGAEGSNAYIGGLSKAMLSGVNNGTVNSLATTINVRSNSPRSSRSSTSWAIGASICFFIATSRSCPFSCVSQFRNGMYSVVTSMKRAPTSVSRRANRHPSPNRPTVCAS